MKDEIKEILEHLSATQKINNGWTSFSVEECKGLYDYITNLQEELDRCVKANIILDDENAELQGEKQNLQEENERLKKSNENASKVCLAEHRYGVDKAEEARDYKSRIDKALRRIDYTNYIECDNEEKWFNYLTELKNILNSGDEE